MSKKHKNFDEELYRESIMSSARFQYLGQSVSEGLISVPVATRLYNNPDFDSAEFEGTANEEKLSDYFYDFLGGAVDIVWDIAQEALKEWLLAELMGLSGKFAARIVKSLQSE